MTAPAPSPVPVKRSKRLYVYWGVALALLLALGAFCWLVVVPVWQVRRAVERCQRLDSFPPHELKRFGGPEVAVGKLALYLRLPKCLAPHRLYATKMLEECRGDRMMSEMLRLLGDDDPNVRKIAADRLRFSNNPEAVPALIAALEDGDGEVRFFAARALGEIRDARAVTPLRTALKDKQARVGVAAAEALGLIAKDAGALEFLKAALTDEDEYVRRHAREALERIKGEVKE